MKKVAIILAGGTGGRLWPESTVDHPKQFKSFVGKLPLVLETYSIANKLFDKEDIYILTFRRYYDLLKATISDIDKANILLEPFGKNTGPAITLANRLLSDKYSDDDIFTYIPSDHLIKNKEAYLTALKSSIESATQINELVSVGIEPKSPNSQLGYIQYEEEKEDNSYSDLFEKGLRKALVFAEKPDIDTAERFIESGDFVWNSGIFSGKYSVINQEIKSNMPMAYDLINKINTEDTNTKSEFNIDYIYKQVNPISIDNGVLEKTKRLNIVKADFDWCDLGTWDEYYNSSEKDEYNNVQEGSVVSVNTFNSLVKSKNKLIAISDIDDLLVVEADNAIYISKRGKSSNIKSLQQIIRSNELNKLL